MTEYYEEVTKSIICPNSLKSSTLLLAASPRARLGRECAEMAASVVGSHPKRTLGPSPSLTFPRASSPAKRARHADESKSLSWEQVQALFGLREGGEGGEGTPIDVEMASDTPAQHR